VTVHLIGAGPGDPELLTIKAARLMAEADAVVYDRLIGDGVLDHVSPTAERHPVGKQPGRPGPSQSQINDLLIDLGRRLTTVVRVKGGDPYLFGRGGEEALALEAAGVAVEVVPGVTSALSGPMAAGVSPTGRGISSGVCIVTGHQDPASADINWAAVAETGLTVIVLMGARRAPAIAARLLACGLAADTPAAVVHNATRPEQVEWFGPLDQLGREPVPSPSVLVIGAAAAEHLRAGANNMTVPALARLVDAAA
jgi:uroporphyrin-III C-methyltransferase